MPAHPEVADIVEEDDSCGGLGVDGFAEKCTDDDLRSARFTNDSAAEVIEFALKTLHAAWEIAGPEIRTSCYNDTRRFPFGVGINDLNRAIGQHGLIVIHIVPTIKDLTSRLKGTKSNEGNRVEWSPQHDWPNGPFTLLICLGEYGTGSLSSGVILTAKHRFWRNATKEFGKAEN
jgi:hypothetical protein